MVIKNAGDPRIREILEQEKIPEGFMIREDEIKALVGLVNALGGSEIVRQKIKRILTEVVERTGRT